MLHRQNKIMLWNVLTIVVALVGGVGAVMLGQILSLYRKDMDTIRQLRSHVKYIQMMKDSNKPVPDKKGALKSSRNAVEDIFRENSWILEEGNQRSMVLISAIEAVRIRFRDGSTRDEWEVLEEECKRIDSEVAHVTLQGAICRYFGTKRPYQNHGSVESN